jgi:tetratricopeptide (TPR) repeat protein
MKKVLVLLAVILTANVMMAQKKDRTDAYMYNKNGQYEKAATSIEKCVNHEAFLGMKPKDQAQAWHYRAMIYQNILTKPEVAAKYPNATDLAYESLEKCIAADKDYLKDNSDDIYSRISSLGTSYFQIGVDKYNEKAFSDAAVNFRKAYDISMNGSTPDTSALMNTAMAYQMGGMYNEALTNYNDLKNLGYDKVDIYQSMAICYGGLNDSQKSLEMVEAGLAKYPGDINLIIAKVNAYVDNGRAEEAIADLDKLLELDPNNATVLFNLGTLYGDDKSALYDGEKAAGYYTRAIEIKPDYSDAIYNLGILYVNMAIKLQNQAADITGISKKELEQVESLQNQAKEYMRSGLPYIKKTYEEQPSDEIKHVLRTMYIQLGMFEEAKALNEQ